MKDTRLKKFPLGIEIEMMMPYDAAGKGLRGIVCAHKPGAPLIGVDFGPRFSGHSLGGKIASATGYWVSTLSARPIPDTSFD